MDNIAKIISSTADKAYLALKENSVLGDPVTVDSTMIIPVYQLSFGFGGGGFDKNGEKNSDSLAAGAGAGVTKKPVSYIVIKDGELSITNAEEPSKPSLIEKIFKFASDRRKKNDKQ
ncbi:MAG: spore germination protein GerW family protein [Acutalibacteraceae bacterium]|nr:spore germination protein GerW family protein [Acutalibacteraceae bacterium]